MIEAILGRDDPVTMRDFMAVVVNEEASEEERCRAYELLIDLVAQIDNANSTVLVFGASPIRFRRGQDGVLGTAFASIGFAH